MTRRPSPRTRHSGEVWEALAAAGLGVYELATWLAGGHALSLDEFRKHLAGGSYYFLAAPPAPST